MIDLEQLSRPQLIALIRSLQEAKDVKGLNVVEHLSNELSIHREELDVQNHELREVSARLEHSRNRYASLFDFAPAGHVSFDRFGIVHEINLTACGMLQIERNKLIGRPFHFFVDLPERLRFINFIRDSMESGERSSADFRILTSNTNTLQVQVNTIVIQDLELRQNFCWASFVDITERKRIENELRASRADLQAVFENTTDVIWSVDHRYNIVTFNSAFNNLRKVLYNSGVSQSVVVPVNNSSDLYKWKHVYDRALHGDQFSFEATYEMEGDQRNYEFRLNPIYSASEVVGVSVFGKDIIERKRMVDALHAAKEKAESLSTFRTKLLSDLSHEIRTPLNVILNYNQLIDESQTLEEVREFSEVIDRNGKRLIALINHTLELAKLEAAEHTLRCFQLDPREQLSRICKMFEPVARAKGLYLRFLPTSSTIVSVDIGALEQVLTNLLGNAIKFTNVGGITVQCEAKGEELAISISDTGIGISKEFIPNLFNEFKREHIAGSQFEGSGLGLAISRSLLAKMGGELVCESQQGVGSTFRIILPSREAAPAGFAVRPSAPTVSKLLVIEDDPDQAVAILKLLEKTWQVDLAPDGETAISLADRIRYNGILLDMSLGDGINGLEVSKRLRQTPTYSETPIIGMTGNASQYSEQLAVDHGCDVLLVKPILPETLSFTLRSLVA